MNKQKNWGGRELHPLVHSLLLETAKSLVRTAAYTVAEHAVEQIEKKHGRKRDQSNA